MSLPMKTPKIRQPGKIMDAKRHIRNFFNPTSMLDKGHIDRFNALPVGNANRGDEFSGSLMQYVANRFTRGSIRGQLFALLSRDGIAERLEKSSKVKWL